MRAASLLVCVLCTVAHAGDERPDPRAALAQQITEQAQTIDKTLSTVGDKLHDADAIRSRRLRAAYRILHAQLSPDAAPSDRMISARRRAAARLLIDRDTAERKLLANEADQLRNAQARTAELATKVPSITLPTELGWPAVGTIARKFGPYQHERSKATLSRRGLDIEVEKRSSAVAPADGVVRYAGPIRGLDFGVILDHGDYLTVIAKLAEPTIPVGTQLTRGDRVGHAARHRVYLEVRVKIGPGGLPIDPEPLLSK